MTEFVNVEGLAEIREMLLKRLPEAMRGKAVQIALAKGAVPIAAAARQLAPVKSGVLKRAIYSFRNRKSTKTYESRLIGVRSGKKARKSKRDAYYWKFIEFGHAIINAKAGTNSMGNSAKGWFGKSVKAVPAKPFMRPAFESQKFKALEIIRSELAGAIEKVAKRASKNSLRKLRRSVLGV